MSERLDRGASIRTSRPAACPTCKRVFTSDANFDRHRTRVSQSSNQRVCTDPSRVGLVLNKSGIWQTATASDRPKHWSQK